MKLKENRLIGLLVILSIYVLTATGGILIYRALSFTPWLSLLIADVAATVIVFAFSLLFNNASVYDPYWSVQPIVIVSAFMMGNDASLSSALVLIAIVIWGVRLTLNWIYTFHDFTYQDWRYVMLREKTGKLYPLINFVGIHLVPTLVVYACTLPAVYVVTDGSSYNAFTFVALALSLFAVILQGVSDVQMHIFRKSKCGGFIRRGFWKHSRHPNYLGEILMWWGVAFFSVSVLGFRWYLILGAVLNTALFLFVSIPMADARQSRKDGFPEYKSETRMLLPIKRFK